MADLKKAFDDAVDSLTKAGKSPLNDLTDSDHPDKEMIDMYEGDARDYEKIAQLIKEGKFRSAASKIDNMDTAARDEVPASIYNTILGDEDNEGNKQWWAKIDSAKRKAMANKMLRIAEKTRKNKKEYSGSKEYHKAKEIHSDPAKLAKWREKHAPSKDSSSSSKSKKGRKTGEGSRGGHVIGRTRSGNPIYSRSSNPNHANFSKAEHQEAARLHTHLAKEEKRAGNDKTANTHIKRAQRHLKHAAKAD